MATIYPTPLTPATINIALQAMTIKSLGLPDNSFDAVRVDWQTFGQPAWTVDQDVVMLRAVQEDSDYDKIRDLTTVFNDDDTVTLVTNYTRVWRVFWTIYGPNSFDRSRILRSSLFNQAIHDMLAVSQLYLVTDPAAPTRFPELFEGLWRERVDFSAQFNEAVYETETTGFVKSVDVVIVTPDNQLCG